jgi:hypothetical protein
MKEWHDRGFWHYFWEDYFHPLLIPPCLLAFFVLVFGGGSDDVSHTERLTASGISLACLVFFLGLPVVLYRIDRRKGDHDAIEAHLQKMGRRLISGERPSVTFRSVDRYTDRVYLTARERALLEAQQGHSPTAAPTVQPKAEVADPLDEMLQRLLGLQEQWRATQNLRPRMRSHAQITLALEVLVQAHRDAIAIPPDAKARQRVIPGLNASMAEVFGLIRSDLDATCEHRADDVMASLRALQRQIAQR